LLCGFEIVDRVSQEFKPTKILLCENHCISVRYTGIHYCSGHKMEKNKLGGQVARMGERRGLYRVLVGKPEGKRQLGRTGIHGRILLRWILRK